MKSIIRAKKGTSAVFAVLTLTMITLALGFYFFNFVMDKVNSMTVKYNSEMSNLIVNSYLVNATHITLWLHNTGQIAIKITGAYVNGLIASLTKQIKLDPGTIEPAVIQGNFQKGGTYSIKLLSALNTVLTFEIGY